MFKIVDGRDYFYQWDLDRQVIVEDPSIVEVHFCNRTDDCSLVVEVVDGLANVPNIILQKSFDVRVFGYDGKATRFDEVFKVKPRTKPADYVYTETEVKNFETLQKYIDERLDEIAENGITVDLTGYAKEQWVKDQGYLTEHQSLEGLATTEYVDEAIANIEIPDVSNFITEIPEEYITQSELSAKNYMTEQLGSIKASQVKDGITLLIRTLTTNTEITKAYTTDQAKERLDTQGVIKWAGADNTYVERHNFLVQNIDSWCSVDETGTVTRINTAENAYKFRTGVVYTFYSGVVADGTIYEYETEEVFRAALKAQLSSGGSVDLSNYYTKDETTQAIQDALNSIGVAEGGAY